MENEMNNTSIADTTDNGEQQVCTEQYCYRYQQSISPHESEHWHEHRMDAFGGWQIPVVMDPATSEWQVGNAWMLDVTHRATLSEDEAMDLGKAIERASEQAFKLNLADRMVATEEDDFSMLWTERAVEESDTDKPAWAATALVYADGSETTYQRKLIEREDFTATLSTDNDTRGEFVQLMCQRASDQWMDFTSPAEALALAESITAAANKWIEIQAGDDL